MLKKPFKAAVSAILFVALFATTALVSCGSSEEKTEEATETVAPAPAAADTTTPAVADTSKKDTMDDASTRPVVPPNRAN